MSACAIAYGSNAPVVAHDCLEHLRTERSEWSETHGFDCGPHERWSEEWEHCTVCGADYEPREVAEMYRERGKAMGAGA